MNTSPASRDFGISFFLKARLRWERSRKGSQTVDFNLSKIESCHLASLLSKKRKSESCILSGKVNSNESAVSIFKESNRLKNENRMINCLLVDDEPLAMDIIASYLAKIPGFKVVTTCKNALEAFDVLQKEEIDLMFLDIQMPQLNGIEFVKTLKNPPKIIFTTAFRDYAIEGFELNAVDYLLKPISFGRFMKAINKIHRKPEIETINPLESQTVSSNFEPFLYIKMDKRILKVYLDEIIYVESQKDYVRIVTEEKDVVTKQKISYLEERLPKDKFLRVHRSYIVPINRITAFSTTNIEIDEIELPIGRSYKQFVTDALNF
ncbi:MAG: DNA-binding LytR/AlgR family response regulator [Cognaticolwellia sp.]